MNRHEFDIYLELYKKKEFQYIPIGSYADGNYFYCTNKQIETLQLLSDDTTTSVGYGGSARCFSGETLVMTFFGHKEIKEIKKGDFVLSYNEKTHKREYKEVLKTFKFSLAEPPKMAIFANNLKCTHDHEFLFRGKWTKASELAKRNLETNRRNLFCINNGKNSYIKPSKQRKTKINDSCKRQQRIFKNCFCNKREKQDNKSSSRNSKSIYRKSKQSKNCKPQKLYKNRQSVGKFRMDEFFRKLQTRLGQWAQGECLEKRRNTTFKLPKDRRKQWVFKINRYSSKRNTTKIYSKKIYKRNVSKRIRSKSINYKRCCIEKKLESREIKLSEFNNIKFEHLNIPIYDLHVKDNHNYTVTKDNIIVHNSGKTVIEVTAIIFDCLAYDGIAWGLARKELTTLKRTALLTLFKQLSFYGFIQDRDFNYNQQLNKIVFNNGSEVFLIDTAYKPSDPLNTRFGGFELTRCAVDESNETAQDVIDKLFERTGWRLNEKYNLKRKVFECFNPAKNHVYSRFYKPFVDKLETLFRKFVLALPSDNPNPAVAEWIKDILQDDKIPEATKQRQIYGNFEYDDNPYALFEYNNILNLFTNEFIKPTKTRYLTCDIAYTGSDKFVLIVWAGLVIEKIIAIDKIDDTQVSKKINELRLEHRIPLKNVIYDADGLQTFTRNSANSGVLSGATQFNNNAVPIKVNGKKENYKNLKAQCYFMLSDVCKDNLLFIQEKNYRTQIIQELEQINRLPFSDDGKLSLEKKRRYS